MMAKKISRRGFLGRCSALTAGTLLSGSGALTSCKGAQNSRTGTVVLKISPTPLFELSPYLYMQFMEPLGTTDTSVDAAWDFNHDRWREDVVEITKELAPTMIRWGGCFVSYYKWKEGVGPLDKRIPMVNQLWGGIYNNQVGTHEFVDFCRQVGAEPLICVNFESDGRMFWANSTKGNRLGNAREAAEWVDYCNNPANRERINNGAREPLNVRWWQLGNETSYDDEGFDCETTAVKSLEFARAMRKADPDIILIGWADSGWAKRIAEVAGEELQYLAFHNHFGPGDEDSPLRDNDWRKDWDRTWEHLMKTCERQESRIAEMREETAGIGIPLVQTEGHFALPGRNRCELLSTWAAGVANARILNVNERNGDILKMATLADFCGNRWQNNAVMIPTPSGHSYMMPVAMVMNLYRLYTGEKAVGITSSHNDLDVTASRTNNKFFLHVINTNRKNSVKAGFNVEGMKVKAGKVHFIALDPEYEVFEYKPEITSPKTQDLEAEKEWTFPASSVSAVELDVEEEA